MAAYLLFSAFSMIDALIPFLSLLDRAFLTTGLSAQQGIRRSRSLGDALFSSWAFHLRLSPDKARKSNKTAKLFPLLHTAAACIGFYLSIYFLSFIFGSAL